MLAAGAGQSGLEGWPSANLGCLVGLQGQEVGLPESSGSLAEGPEKGCFAEAGGGPEAGTADGQRRPGD